MPFSCSVCKSVINKKYSPATDPVTGEKFSIFICSSCNLGHTLPIPINIIQYYGNEYHKNRHGFSAYFRAIQRFKSIVEGESNIKLLDIGCGEGTFLHIAKKKGWKVFGTEINDKIAKKSGLDVFSSIKEVSQYGLFDYITLFHSLEHFNSPQKTIFDITKLLKIEGSLIIAVPNSGSLQAKIFKNKWFPLDVPRHLYHFDKQSLTYLLKSYGFKIKKIQYGEIEYDIIGWVQSVLNIIFPIQNIFFNCLTGQTLTIKKSFKLLNIFAGIFLSIILLPFIMTEGVFKKNGTIIITAEFETKKG